MFSEWERRRLYIKHGIPAILAGLNLANSLENLRREERQSTRSMLEKFYRDKYRGDNLSQALEDFRETEGI